MNNPASLAVPFYLNSADEVRDLESLLRFAETHLTETQQNQEGYRLFQASRRLRERLECLIPGRHSDGNAA